MKVLPDANEIYSNKSINRLDFHSIFLDLIPEYNNNNNIQ